LDDSTVPVDFGAWTPTGSGDYLVEITPNDSQTDGQLSNTLHVGPSATGTMGLTQTLVLPGDRPVAASLRVVGADSTSITHIDPQGKTLATQSGAVGRAVAADSSGNIYASGGNKIVKITPGGTISDFVTNITLGYGLAADSLGNIYAVSGSSLTNIVKITPQGQIQTLATLANQASVTTDLNDRLYAVDRSGKLSRISPDGTVTTVSTVGLTDPRAVAIDAFGNFYVLNTSKKIIRITPGGESSTSYFDQATFEFEGINISADCSNNLLFAPTVLPIFKEGANAGEEDTLLQLVGDTGEIRQVMYGPDINPALTDIDVLFYDRMGHRLLIYTDYSGGKIFSIPVICGGINADAHIVTRADIDLSSADPSPSNIANLADGTKEYTWSLTDVDSKGLNIQLNLLFHNLAENEVRPAVSDAFLVFNNSFMPGESVRVPISIPSLRASSAMSLNPTLDGSSYGPQARVGISVTVGNDSGTAFDGSLTLTIADSAGATVENLPPITITALSGLTSAVFASEWYTGSTLAGGYKLTVRLSNAAGMEMGQGEVPFTITAVQQLAAQIVTDKTQYGANKTATLSSTISNMTTNASLAGLSATVTVVDPNGAAVFTETRSLSDLLPSSGTGFKSFWSVGTSAPGNYTAVLTVTSAGGLTATSTASFSIASSLDQAKALAGTITNTPNGIIEGETTHLDYMVQNIGNVLDVPQVTLEILVVNPDTGSVMRTLTDSASLNSREIFTNGLTFESAGFAPANYLFILRGIIGEVVQTLSSAALTISPIPNTAPTANAGPDLIGSVGQLVTLDGTGSSDPEGDPLTYHWAFVSVPQGSARTNADLNGAATATPSFVPDINGSYLLSLVVNDGHLDSQTDQVAVQVSPPIQIDLHPETINLKSNGGSTSVTVVLFSPVLGSFIPFTGPDGVTVTATFNFTHTYIDKNGNAVTFTTPITDYPGDDFVQAVDLDGDGTIDGYQVILKIDRPLIVNGFTDSTGALRITQPTALTLTAFGNGLAIGSDINTAIAPPDVTKGGK
jgi:streptogramin lyase